MLELEFELLGSEAEAVELLEEKNAALLYDCGNALLKLLPADAVVLCAGRVDILPKGRVCEACMRHRAQSRVTSRRAIAVAAGERIAVFFDVETALGEAISKKDKLKQKVKDQG